MMANNTGELLMMVGDMSVHDVVTPEQVSKFEPIKIAGIGVGNPRRIEICALYNQPLQDELRFVLCIINLFKNHTGLMRSISRHFFLFFFGLVLYLCINPWIIN